VTNEDLPYLYAGARLFVFPSHYEGFGLPVLESMASGVPVVCSNSSSLPEVVGDAALTCDHDDIDTLRQLISRGLEDDDWRVEAIIKGLHRAATFSWDNCAEQTIQVYRELAARDLV
jgi:alpha-1,3-rhamnosyl/mannosyltransferase